MQLCHISPIFTRYPFTTTPPSLAPKLFTAVLHSPVPACFATTNPRPSLLRQSFCSLPTKPLNFALHLLHSHIALFFCTYYPFHRPLPTTVRPVMCVPLRIFSLFRILHTPNMSDFFASFIPYLQRFRTCFAAAHLCPAPTCFTASPSLLLHIFFATNLPASDFRLSFVRGSFCSLLRTCCAAVRSPVFFVYFYNSASLLSLPFSEILFSFSSNPAPHPCSRTAPVTRLKQKDWTNTPARK